MKRKIHILIPGDEVMPCPSCGKPIIVNEEALHIYHINPACEWFCIHAHIANCLADANTERENKRVN
jgi:hypothetical protein